MEQGEIFTAEIEDMNTLGNGIAKSDGCVIFCYGAADGDRVTAQIRDKKKNFMTADVVSTDAPSPYRCAPDCKAFGVCGGCTLRHITYEHEKDVKLSAVKAALRRLGVPDGAFRGIYGTNSERYRNKAVFRFRGSEFGFSAERSDDIVPVSDCLLCPEIFSETAAYAAKYFEKDPLSYLYLRTNHDGSEISCVLGKNNDCTEFAKKLSERFPCVAGVFQKSGKHPEDGTKARLIYGKEYINEKFLSMELCVSPDSFFQINREGAEALCRRVCEYACASQNSYGADLYCGTGIIGLSLAALCPDAHITGVEINSQAVEDAKKNAQRNGLSNIGFFCGDSADFAKSIYGSLDFITIDPPRAGCSEKMIKELLRISPERIVYISCEPASLARDLKLLCEKYAVADVSVFDLFPRTKHVETVCLLTRETNPLTAV